MTGSLPVPCVVCGVPRQVDPARKNIPCVACKRHAALLDRVNVRQGDWVDDALCVQVGGEVFFPNHQGGTRATARQAKEVCFECPVRLECLQYSFDAEEPYGVWGGVDEVERRNIIKKRKRKGLIA